MHMREENWGCRTPTGEHSPRTSTSGAARTGCAWAACPDRNTACRRQSPSPHHRRCINEICLILRSCLILRRQAEKHASFSPHHRWCDRRRPSASPAAGPGRHSRSVCSAMRWALPGSSASMHANKAGKRQGAHDDDDAEAAAATVELPPKPAYPCPLHPPTCTCATSRFLNSSRVNALRGSTGAQREGMQCGVCNYDGRPHGTSPL